MSSVSPDWYDGLFEREWLQYLAATSPELVEQQVRFLVGHLDLREGTRVLDVACGRGRIAVPLAQRGCRVTGIDLSPNSLTLAREAAAEAGIELELRHLDMRELDYDGEFDVVINVFTSFGYFADEADDQRVLDRVARALVPDGAFLLDTINTVALAREFRERDWREFDDGALLLEERRYDHLSGRHEATWTFVRSDGSRSELRHSLRGYTAAELRSMLGRAGLTVDAAWGSWGGTDLGDGTRTILRARRPG